jgi:hypothetical protein
MLFALGFAVCLDTPLDSIAAALRRAWRSCLASHRWDATRVARSYHLSEAPLTSGRCIEWRGDLIDAHYRRVVDFLIVAEIHFRAYYVHGATRHNERGGLMVFDPWLKQVFIV